MEDSRVIEFRDVSFSHCMVEITLNDRVSLCGYGEEVKYQPRFVLRIHCLYRFQETRFVIAKIFRKLEGL